MARMMEKVFQSRLKDKLGELYYPRALEVFRNCDPHLSWELADILYVAANRGRVEDVLEILEGEAGVDRTEAAFQKIYEKVLDPQSTT